MTRKILNSNVKIFFIIFFMFHCLIYTAQTVNLSNTSINTCSAVIYDPQGPSANYTDPASGSLTVNMTVCSNAATSIYLIINGMALSGPNATFNQGADNLIIYDGTGTGGTVLYNVIAGISPANGIIGSSGTCLTISFITVKQSIGAATVGPGFTITATCTKPQTCSDGILNNGEVLVDCGGSNCSPCYNSIICGAEIFLNGDFEIPNPPVCGAPAGGIYGTANQIPRPWHDQSPVANWWGTQIRGTNTTVSYPSPDYFSNCTNSSTVPVITGSKSMGYFGHFGGSQSGEYIQELLASPLIAGEEYCVSLKAKSSNSLGGAGTLSDAFGIWFHNRTFFSGNGFLEINNDNGASAFIGAGTTINAIPQVRQPLGNLIPVTATNLNFSFCAAGGEQYAVVGNFNPGSSPQDYIIVDDLSIKQSCPLSFNSGITSSGTPDCTGSCVVLTANASNFAGGCITTNNVSYLWSTGAITSTINVCPTSASIFTVQITYNAGCKTLTKTEMINFCGVITPSVSINSATVCTSNCAALSPTVTGGSPPYTYTWSPALGLSSVSSANVFACPLASIVYTLSVSDASSSVTTSTAAVTVVPIPTITVNNPTICANTTATLIATGATNYTWSAGTTPSSGSVVTVNPSATTVYNLIGTSSNCISTATASVNVIQTPTITASNYTICAGSSATLTANGASNYTWSPGTTLNSTNGSSVIDSPITSTTYTILGANGICTSTTTTSVTLASSLSITSNSASICNGAATLLSASGASSYTWSPSATLSSGNGTTVTATPTVSTTYTINGSSGTCTGSTSVLVHVDPTPTITVTSATICSGASTIISAGGAATYSWSSGLGSTSGATVTANPPITTIYTVTGTSNGCSADQTFTIYVIPNPTITVNSPTICPGSSATLTAIGAFNYTWSPGGTLSSTTGSSVIASPITTTTYSVVGSNGTCISSVTTSVTVAASLTIVSNSSAICVGTNTTLSVSGATSYTWNPSTNLSASTGATVIATPTTSTTYTIIGSTGLCTDSTTLFVQAIPSPTITVNSATICSGASTIVNAGGATTYFWSAGLGSTTGTTVTANPLTTTIYTVTGTSSGCSASETLTITVVPTPIITSNNYTTCPGGSATLTVNGATNYTWSPSSTLSSSNGAVVVSTPITSTNYTVVGAIGTCTSMATSNVNVNFGLAISTNSAAICAGSNTLLVASGATNYTWTPSLTLNSNSGTTVTATPTITTTYTILGQTGTCTGTTTALVVVSSSPTITVNSPTLCSGSSVILTAAGATSYSWNNGATTQTVLVSPSTTVIYTVTGTSNNCISSNSATVSVLQTPTISVSSDTLIVKGNSTTLIANTDGNSVYWSPSTGLSCSTCAITIATPSVSTQYCITSIIGNCSVSGCINVNVELACYANTDYGLPNAFTPNGDGINDEFCLKGWADCTTSFYISIFNRWGEKVFDSSDPDFCWDGSYLGVPQNAAVFVYYVNAEILKVGKVSKTGNITLIK